MKDRILRTASDLMSDFLFYDRKEDFDLPVGAIEKAIKSGEISIDDIIDLFRSELETSVGSEAV